MRRIIIGIWALAGLLALSAGGQAAAETLTAKRAAEEPLRFGYRADARPFSFVEVGGSEPLGFTIDLCERVRAAAEAEGLSVAYVEVTAGDRFEALAAGRIDLLCGATSFTLERQRAFDFSLLTFVTSAAAMYRDRDAPDDGFGRRVGVIENSTTAALVGELQKKVYPAFEIATYETHNAGAAALRAGLIDSYYGDRILLRQIVAEADGVLDLGSERYPSEPYALAVRKGDVELLFLVNRALAQTYRDGAIDDVFRKWFGDVRRGQTLDALYVIMTAPVGAPLE